MCGQPGSLASRFAAALAAACLLVAPPVAGAQSPPDYAKFRADWAAEVSGPYGWCSLVALAKLGPGETTVGSAPGNAVVIAHVPAHLVTLRTVGNVVTIANVSPDVWLGPHLAHMGEVLTKDQSDANGLRWGQVKLWVIERGGERFLRVKDPAAPGRRQFHGLRWYAPDPKYRIEARWIPYSTPQPLRILNRIGQLSTSMAPGYAEFMLDGKRETLVPQVEDNDLFFILTDRTARTDTDEGGRFLTTPLPSHGVNKPGTVELDFNETENLSCAYTPFATCPLAPAVNRLNVAIPAGEKRY